MRLASSWMVIVSGIVTSRAIFSFCSTWRWPMRRWLRRRKEASERVRSSSPEVALARVRRPRRFSSPGAVLGVFGRAAGLAATPGRRMARAPSSCPPRRRGLRREQPCGHWALPFPDRARPARQGAPYGSGSADGRPWCHHHCVGRRSRRYADRPSAGSPYAGRRNGRQDADHRTGLGRSRVATRPEPVRKTGAGPLRPGGGGPRPRRGACARRPGGGARLPRACGLRQLHAPGPRRPRARRGGLPPRPAACDPPPRGGAHRRARSCAHRAPVRRASAAPRRSDGAYSEPCSAADGRPGPEPPASGRRGAGFGAAAGAAACCGAGSSSLPPGPTAGRRLTVSTTTAFERPWEKLWRTTPCSTGRFRDSVLDDTWRVLSPWFFVSVIPLSSCGFQ